MALGNPLPSPNFLLQVADVLPAAAPLRAPTGVAVVANVGGGTFAAASYFWKVTATNASGESVASPEVTVAVALNGTATITWAQVAGATGYRVYRGAAKDGESVYFVIGSGATLTFTDTGAAGTAGTIPVPTWNTVPLLNSWDADYNEQVSEYDVFGQSDPIEVNGRAKSTMSFGGYLPDGSDSGSLIIQNHQNAKDFMLVRVLWDGTNGFYAYARINTNKASAKAGANLIETTYTFTILPSSITMIGTGPIL